MFPSISRLFLRWRGPKSIAKLDEGMVEFPPLDPPLSVWDCWFHWLVSL